MRKDWRLALDRVASSPNQMVRRNKARLLRLALGTVFLWFRALKALGETSVLGIIQAVYPFLAQPPYLQALGVGEMVLGTGVLLGSHTRVFASLMVFHLAGTLMVPFLAPAAAFSPSFPVLTLEGEFVLKNLVLISAALLLAEGTLA